jgi:anti-anti-sigma regulatory factor
METLTNTNNDTDNVIIYENKICVITEHVNYIKVLFIKELIGEISDFFDFEPEIDLSHKIKETLAVACLDKFLILDFINVRFCNDRLYALLLKLINVCKEKPILCNLKPYIMQEIRMVRMDGLFSIY